MKGSASFVMMKGIQKKKKKKNCKTLLWSHDEKCAGEYWHISISF